MSTWTVLKELVKKNCLIENALIAKKALHHKVTPIFTQLKVILLVLMADINRKSVFSHFFTFKRSCALS